MILTLKEQAIIKSWNKLGVGGLRLSSLALLENIGVRNTSEDDSEMSNDGVCRMLCRHTMRLLPEGLWDRSQGFCEELCFLAGVDFKEYIYLQVRSEEKQERQDEEFDDDYEED